MPKEFNFKDHLAPKPTTAQQGADLDKLILQQTLMRMDQHLKHLHLVILTTLRVLKVDPVQLVHELQDKAAADEYMKLLSEEEIRMQKEMDEKVSAEVKIKEEQNEQETQEPNLDNARNIPDNGAGPAPLQEPTAETETPGNVQSPN